MPRAGLDRHVVTTTAATLVDEDGASALSLARVAAELGVKPPSLYNHVDGLDGLLRRVALLGIDELAEVCRVAAMGRSGSDAMEAVVTAYRGFATSRPGVYPLTQVARPGDEDFEAAATRVLEPVLAVLASFGLDGDDLIHAARSVRSALHGFVLLETSGGFGMQVDPRESFQWMIGLLTAGLSDPSTRAASR